MMVLVSAYIFECGSLSWFGFGADFKSRFVFVAELWVSMLLSRVQVLVLIRVLDLFGLGIHLARTTYGVRDFFRSTGSCIAGNVLYSRKIVCRHFN